MSVEERLKRAGTLIKSLGAFLALLPGIAVLLGLVAIPPSLAVLIKFISFAISIAVILAIIVLSENVGRMRNLTAALLIVGSAVTGASVATAYFIFAGNHIATVTDGEDAVQHVIPLRPSGRIHALVDPYDGDYVEALQTSVQRASLADLMRQESGSATALMITLLVLSETLVVLAIVLGAWKLTAPTEIAP